MGGIYDRTGGTTLVPGEGPPSARRAVRGAKMDRWITLGFLAAALVATLFAAARVACPRRLHAITVRPGNEGGKPGGQVVQQSVRTFDAPNGVPDLTRERPLPFRPCSFFVLGSHTMANRSPPMPLPVGSMSPIAALAASTIAASSGARATRALTSSESWSTGAG